MKKNLLISLILFVLIILVLSLSKKCLTQEEGMEEEAESSPTYTSFNLRDPFVVFSQGKAQTQQVEQGYGEITPPDILVEGMVWETEFPQAILDSQVVRLGDTVKDAKIVEINKYGVVISYQGKLFIGAPGGKFQPVEKQGE